MAILAAVFAFVASTVTAAPAAHADVGAMIQPTSGTVTYVVGGCSGDRPTHTGVDIAGNAGRQISATYDGVVTTRVVNYGTSGYGNYVVVTHTGGYSTLYAHMRDAPSVELGQTVTRGQRLGFVGSTGNSTGPHLHFELRQNGSNLVNSAYACRQTITAGTGIPIDFPGLTTGVVPTPAPESTRSYALLTDGTLEGKETEGSRPVVVQRNVRAAAAGGDTIATVLFDGTVWIKTGQFTSGNWLLLATGAVDLAVDGERFVVLHQNGDVTAKDGLFTSEWYLIDRNVTRVAADNGRVGVVADNGVFRVKDGSLTGGWTVAELGATDIAVDGNRLGVVTGGTAKAKVGSLTTPWRTVASAQRIELSEDRLAISGFDGVFVKEGGLDARWLRIEEPATDLALSGGRVGIVRTGVARVKTGALGGRWLDYYSNAARIYLG